MASEFVTARQLVEFLPYSRRHIADRITRMPTFPAPRRAGNVRFWSLKEVLAWWNKKKER